MRNCEASSSVIMVFATFAILAACHSTPVTPTPVTSPPAPVVPPPTPTQLNIRVINIIPEAMSAETNQDSEPNLAVNPADVDQIAASAFTPNPVSATGNAPIFVSVDAGETWALNPIVQSQRSTSDITIRFTRTTNTLYAGILRLPFPSPNTLRMSIQSTSNFTAATPMTVLVDRTGPDQPYVQATDIAGSDRVYVGNNDLGLFPGQTATVDQTVDGAASFTIQRVERRATSGQDLPPVRPAIGPNRVIYVAYLGRRVGGVSDVVVVRDDNGATGTNPYQALIDPGDGQAGVRVVSGRNIPFENFSHANLGQERLVASDLSLSVDPNDSARVCIAWGDRQGAEVLTLHLRCSSDSGQTWSTGDLRTLTNAKNPALAFNSQGRLGFLYQSVEGSTAAQRWVTHFERLDQNFQQLDDTVLATVPANTPARTFLPYIGDYVHLMAVDRTFYGIFSANNTPSLTNFPQGVVYQRRADFNSQTLQDFNGNSVNVSIDPFFFWARE